MVNGNAMGLGWGLGNENNGRYISGNIYQLTTTITISTQYTVLLKHPSLSGVQKGLGQTDILMIGNNTVGFNIQFLFLPSHCLFKHNTPIPPLNYKKSCSSLSTSTNLTFFFLLLFVLFVGLVEESHAVF